MNLITEQSRNEENEKIQGYPFYPACDDIYKRFLEERNIDPEDIPGIKVSNEKYISGARNDKSINDSIIGSDLDIPGAELDDEQEKIGNEDEENNYYSLGGDDHNDLDEDNVQ